MDSRIKSAIRILKTGLVPTFALCAMVSCAKAEESITFKEICDASTAIALGPDTFLVADDEKSDALRVYRASGGAPIEYKKLPEAWADKEADLEGSAKVGSEIYWISSHGFHKNKEKKEMRRQFFAIDASFNLVGKPYQGLVEQILNQPWAKKYKLEKAVEKKPEDDGLNVEALAAWGADGVLIGLRSPLAHHKAIAIPLENPRDVVNGTAPPRLGEPLEFDLDRLGIRSMEKVGDVYWIVGGPKGPGEEKTKKKSTARKEAFKLFSWSGRLSDEPVFNRDLPEGMNFEALFEMNGKLWVLADDGQVKQKSTECKDLLEGEQQFRGLSIQPDPVARKR